MVIWYCGKYILKLIARQLWTLAAHKHHQRCPLTPLPYHPLVPSFKYIHWFLWWCTGCPHPTPLILLVLAPITHTFRALWSHDASFKVAPPPLHRPTVVWNYLWRLGASLVKISSSCFCNIGKRILLYAMSLVICCCMLYLQFVCMYLSLAVNHAYGWSFSRQYRNFHLYFFCNPPSEGIPSKIGPLVLLTSIWCKNVNLNNGRQRSHRSNLLPCICRQLIWSTVDH